MHGLDRPSGELAALLGECELHGARIARVLGALEKAGGLQAAGQLGDVQGVESGVVGRPPLAGLLAGALHAVQRRHQ
ncbi:hypothetical protein GCM10010121_005390 [Streptomyces brasiliensis]|uniref:Uncharacterized protein n=1 Tax=Streptomyces brasiliensis TaxID=1954 RepID=A0A917NFV8_9ACTN|nr:hypothetical protein GCM10010121_005390 [Streptomyces brasiliensis]